jgi:hypothetical protein
LGELPWGSTQQHLTAQWFLLHHRLQRSVGSNPMLRTPFFLANCN